MNRPSFPRRGPLPSLLVLTLVALSLLPKPMHGSPASTVRFATTETSVQIYVGDQLAARYVFEDPEIPRPYFCDVRTPEGIPTTRNHPPIEGIDPTDHGTYHPGIWLAFGDVSGADFWRQKAQVDHAGFASPPSTKDASGSFTVSNVYRKADEVICRETLRVTIVPVQEEGTAGFLLVHDSEFSNADKDFVFGDQEEMGLGVRMATPLSVKHGNGTMTNAEGLVNEAEVWGKATEWCDYSGMVEGRRVGMTVLSHPENFRPSWMHARDYGLLVANPFGREALTKGEKSAVAVRAGEKFRLRFAVWVYATSGGSPYPLEKVRGLFLKPSN